MIITMQNEIWSLRRPIFCSVMISDIRDAKENQLNKRDARAVARIKENTKSFSKVQSLSSFTLLPT